MNVRRHHRGAYTLTELVCVIAIITVLVTLYGGAVARAYVKIRHFLENM